MNADFFLDTNILLYACSGAAEDAAKKEKACELVLEKDFALSSQVLQEFIANGLRKKSLGITEAVIDSTLELASHVPVQSVDFALVVRAQILRRKSQLSHWDSTIVAAAQELRCHTLYSEDLTHGQQFGGVQICNPFLD